MSDNIFSFRQITENHIFKIIKNISSKSYGPDSINITMLTLIMPHCIYVVLKLFNDSITQGIVPNICKSADIVPLPKTSNPNEFLVLRPISLLLAKVFEEIISSQVLNYLEVEEHFLTC